MPSIKNYLQTIYITRSPDDGRVLRVHAECEGGQVIDLPCTGIRYDAGGGDLIGAVSLEFNGRRVEFV